MSDKKRMVLIALGISILVVLLLPLLFMAGMMSGMGGMMAGMGNMEMGKTAMSWVTPALFVLVFLMGIASLTAGLRR
jgi:hypothetical protein